jgi:hypothetical protein
MKKILSTVFFLTFNLTLILSSDLYITMKNPWGSFFFVINKATGQILYLDYKDKNMKLINTIEENNKIPGKYLPCVSEDGKKHIDAYILNTANGDVYSFFAFDPKNSLKKIENKLKLKEYEIGSYIPISNPNGGGFFIFNKITGECYWTGGNDWEVYAKNNK